MEGMPHRPGRTSHCRVWWITLYPGGRRMHRGKRPNQNFHCENLDRVRGHFGGGCGGSHTCCGLKDDGFVKKRPSVETSLDAARTSARATMLFDLIQAGGF